MSVSRRAGWVRLPPDVLLGRVQRAFQQGGRTPRLPACHGYGCTAQLDEDMVLVMKLGLCHCSLTALTQVKVLTVTEGKQVLGVYYMSTYESICLDCSSEYGCSQLSADVS